MIIEEITRNHKLLHRHRLSQNSITIGRDYNNDIIITVPYICPQHLSLNYDQGSWQLNDNNSINGTIIEKTNAKSINAHQQTINDGDIVILGKRQLQIRFKSHHVADTVTFSSFEYLINFIRNPMTVFASIVLFMLIAANHPYLNQVTATNISQLFVDAVSKTLLLGLWPAVVALASHLTTHEPRILA